MGPQKLKENFLSLLSAVMKAKPATSKGIYLRKLAVSSTMGPGISLDVAQAQNTITAAQQ
jgi:large subunit ribosomal protein L1